MDMTLATDVRHALRRFMRAPGFTIVALSIIALGIAANVGVFSVANAVVLKPSGFPEPERVVYFATTSPQASSIGASPALYRLWRTHTDVLQDITAFNTVGLNDTSGTRPTRVQANRVSANYFRLFGATVSRGRAFSEQEDRPGGDRVVLLSHLFWQRRFGGDPVVLGQPIVLNGEAHTVIGVLDAASRLDDLGPAPDVFLPLQLDPQSTTAGNYFSVCGRLRRGVTLEQARSRVRASTEAYRQEFPSSIGPGSAFDVQPVQDVLVGNTGKLLFVLLGAVGLVLLIACSNIASLLLLQASSRTREICVRATLGAGRGRILRQLLTESLLLAAAGGAAGLALGWFLTRAVMAADLASLPRLGDVESLSIDWRVVAFTVTVSVLTGVLFGLVPALHLARVDLSSSNRSADGRSSAGPGTRRTQAALVVMQISLAVVLLIGSMLFMRTVAKLATVDVGFDPSRTLTLRASVNGPDLASTPQVAAVIRRGMEALSAIPGASTVGASCGLPLVDGFGLPFEIVGRPLPAGSAFHGGGGWLAVSPGYFEALSIPVERGRSFTERDVRASRAVAVINDVMARQQWPDTDPIGQRIVLGHGIGREFQDEPVREIVGVVGSVRGGTLDAEPGAEVYVPQAQLSDVSNAFVFGGAPVAWVVRTSSSPESMARPLQLALERATGLPVTNVRPMGQIVLGSISRQRFSTWLMTAFGAAALLLATLGIYGLIAHSVRQRRREIGIRIALGAESAQVRTMMVREGLVLTAAGLGAGLLGAFWLTRLATPWLYGVTSSDPVTFIAVPAAVGTAALLAIWLPSRRASGVDPSVALRSE